MPDFPVHHQLPELAQTHVHRVSDAIVSLAHYISLPHIDDTNFHNLVKMVSIVFFHCRDTLPPFK